MRLAATRGVRSRWAGWMRPRVGKVGAAPVATGVLSVGRRSRGCREGRVGTITMSGKQRDEENTWIFQETDYRPQQESR